MFVGTAIYALINSAILALVAIGFNLTFGISGVANFAYGAFYVLAAYGIWGMLNLLHFPYLVAVLLAVSANVFVGMVEAPLFVRPYLETITRRQLFTLMTAGMATIAGTVMVFKTYDRISYGLVMEATQAIHIHDFVRNPT